MERVLLAVRCVERIVLERLVLASRLLECGVVVLIAMARILGFRLLGVAVGISLLAGAACSSGSPSSSVSGRAKVDSEVLRAAEARPNSLLPLIVREATPSSDAAERLVKGLGGTVTHDLSIIGGFSAKVPAKSLHSLLDSPHVSRVWSDGRVRVTDSLTDEYDVLQPNKVWQKAIKLADARPYNGSGITVAVLDTGIRPVPDLAGRILASADFTSEGDGLDRYGHGTHMAGIIAGNGTSSGGTWTGVAPKAKLVSVKVAGADGSTDVSVVIAGLQWVVANREQFNIRVLNLSFGTDSLQSYLVDPLNYAVEQVWFSGIFVAVAAGNGGPMSDTINKPADDPYVVSVGAANLNGTSVRSDDFVAEFSSRGASAVEETSEGVAFLVIDEDSIDNGNAPNYFSDVAVNDHIAKVGLRKELSYFNANLGSTITLHTGKVGDEGWFAPRAIPAEWSGAGPTQDGLRNFVGNPALPYPHGVGPGLGSGNDPERLLDKVPDVTPLRTPGLEALEGTVLCAVVYDGDVSINYDPLNGSLKGANLGTVAVRVKSMSAVTGSSDRLPKAEVTILDSETTCGGSLELFSSEETSSSAVLEKPDLLAPGISIVSNRVVGSTVDLAHPLAAVSDHYMKGTGTSQATAIISGVAALMLQARPSMTPNAAKATVNGTAGDGTATQPGGGDGLVNARDAVWAAYQGAYSRLPANQNLTPSSGTGSLEASRGSFHIEVDMDGDGAVEPLEGEIGFGWAEGSWSAGSWRAGSWRAGSWRAGEWSAGSWRGAEWTAGSWRTGEWSASSWRADTWSASSWRASSWRADSWSASVWS
jgi:serine protease AprX